MLFCNDSKASYQKNDYRSAIAPINVTPVCYIACHMACNKDDGWYREYI